MTPLLHLARSREIAGALASSSDEIIAASRGLAAAIAAERLRNATPSGPAGLSAPRISTLEDFARAVVNDAGDYPRIAADAERRLAMRAAAAGTDDPMLHTRGIAAMLERSYRDVRDSGVSLAELERRVREARGLRNAERTRTILQVWQRYERLIAEVQAADPADVLMRAAELIESGRAAIAPQAVAGFYDMTGAQLRIVSALGAAGKLTAIHVPAREGDAYAFASRLLTRLPAVVAAPSPSRVLRVRTPSTRVVQSRDVDTELRGVCRAIRELLDAGVPAASIGITARSLDPDDVRLLERFSADLGFAVSERNAVPLIGHRAGRAIATLLRMRERNFPRADVIDVLRDGFITERRVDVDGIDKATRRARISGGRSADLRNPLDDPRIDDYRAVVAEMEKLPGASAEMMAAAISRIRLETEADLAAAAEIDEAIALLRRASRWKIRFDAETAAGLLEQSALRQPANDQPAVWLGDVMRFRGRTFEHLFVIRMQESVAPQRRVDDPLVPDADRRRLGLREIGDGRDEERLLFQLLLDGAAASVEFSYATTERFGKILRPSPLLKTLGPPAHAAPAGKPATMQPGNLPRQLHLLASAGRGSIFDGYLFARRDHPALRAAIVARVQSVSPTRLEDFGECPQKFLFKHILGVHDYDTPERELQLDRREKGKLVHEVLERFYGSIDPKALTGAAAFFPQLDPGLRERIDALIDEAFDAEEARLPPFNRLMRDIERKATKRNLHAFVAGDLEELSTSGLRPRHFEYAFGRGESDPFVLSAHGVPIRVEGSIDRIDEGGGKLRIVDYKSGKAGRHANLAEKIDRGVRLQLALYAMAVCEFFGVAPAAVSGAIKPLVIGGPEQKKMSFELGETEGRLRETLDLFVLSMMEGRFPAFPNEGDDARSFNSCKYCPVNGACRTRHSTVERRALAGMKDPRSLLESLA